MSLNKETKKKLIEKFGLHPDDTGSVEVQVAMLTESIRKLTDHLKKNSKDFASKRGLLLQVAQRRSFLKYLAKHDPEKYKLVVERLDLKS
jgi:small subunit ribosomal protein S15